MNNTPLYDKRSLKLELNRAGLVMLMLLATQNMLTMPFLVMRRNSQLSYGQAFTPLVGAMANLVIYLASMLLTLSFAGHLFQRKPAFLYPMGRVRRDYLVPAVGAGVGACMAISLAVSVVIAMLGGMGLTFKNYVPTFGHGVAADLLTMVYLLLLPPVLEELLFRGAILQSLRRYGDRVAIVVSAALFALCHGTLPQMLSAFLVGLVLGIFTVRSGSLGPAMAIHLLNNGVAVMVAWVASRSGVFAASGFNMGLLLGLLTLGGLCCLPLSRRFGRVWWVPQGGTPAVPAKIAAWLTFTSAPVVAAAAFYFLNMLRNNFLG